MNINCPHFTVCSGCQLDTAVDKLLLLKEARTFFADKGIPHFQLHTGSPTGWRCRAKLAIRGSVTKPLVGLYEKDSHRITDIPNCKVHHPLINQAANILRAWITQHKIIPYNEVTGTGQLRYAQMTVERDTGKIQLVLVLNASNEEYLKDVLKSLYDNNSSLWHSLWVNFNTRRDNVIFGQDWKLLYGNPWLWERFCGKSVCFHPASFFQANPEMFERLLKSIQKAVPQKSKLIEFYAGVGVIGLTLAEQCETITCTEIVPLAGACFEESLKTLPEELKRKFSYKTCDAKSALDLLKEPVDVAIVDPPRKGLDGTLLKALSEAVHIKTLIYVSCGWEAFKRDCELLLAAGWNLQGSEAFLFFPGTEHIETLTIFNRLS